MIGEGKVANRFLLHHIPSYNMVAPSLTGNQLNMEIELLIVSERLPTKKDLVEKVGGAGVECGKDN